MAARLTRWLDADEQEAWRAFLRAQHDVFEAIEAGLQRDAGIPHTYYEILVQLSETPGRALRMSDLASRSLSSRSKLSHAVNRLVELGWVCRLSCPTDKRGQIAQLTDAGFAALEQAAPGHVECVRSVLFDVLTPAQVKQLRDISKALTAPDSNQCGDDCPDR